MLTAEPTKNDVHASSIPGFERGTRVRGMKIGYAQNLRMGEVPIVDDFSGLMRSFSIHNPRNVGRLLSGVFHTVYFPLAGVGNDSYLLDGVVLVYKGKAL